MDEFGCDYACRTVGESIVKYNIPNAWFAEFDACDGPWPTIVMQMGQVRKASAMMSLRLRIIENPDDEFAGCLIFPERKTIVFKVDYMRDLAMAMKPGKKK